MPEPCGCKDQAKPMDTSTTKVTKEAIARIRAIGIKVYNEYVSKM